MAVSARFYQRQRTEQRLARERATLAKEQYNFFSTSVLTDDNKFKKLKHEVDHPWFDETGKLDFNRIPGARASIKIMSDESVSSEENNTYTTKDEKGANTVERINFPYTGITSVDSVREYAYAIVNHTVFTTSIIALIIINSIMMGINTYLPDIQDENYNSSDYSEMSNVTAEVIAAIDKIVLFIFTFELGLNVITYLHLSVKDPWLVFDAVTIFMSWSFSNFSIIRR